MVPQNELGVIVEFSQRAKEAGITILSIQSAFPDAQIEKDGQIYLVEFEFKSSSFVYHGHDIRNVDLIICWEDDYNDITLPVIELSNENWVNFNITPLSAIEKEAFYWKQKALIAERKLSELAAGSLSQPCKTTETYLALNPKNLQEKLISIPSKREKVLLAAEVLGKEVPNIEIAKVTGASSAYISEVLRKAGIRMVQSSLANKTPTPPIERYQQIKNILSCEGDIGPTAMAKK